MLKNNLTRLALSVVVGAVSFLLLAGDLPAQKKKEGSGPPPTVTVMKVSEEDVNPATEFVGRVEALQTVDLSAQVDGYIEKVLFDEGAEVKAGSLLFLIEQAPYKAKVNEAKAKVALAQATLDRSLRYLERLRTVRAGGVSGTDMDSALAAEQIARAQLQEARASLGQAEVNLGYTTIKAPIGGRIGRAAYTLGNLVGPASGPLARIVQLNPIRVIYSVSENEYVTEKMKIASRPGSKPVKMVPRLRLPDGQMYPADGEMDFTDPQVDPGTGTIAMRAVFDNPNAVLLPGQYVTVLLSRRQPQRFPVIPQSAALEDREGLYVLVVDDDNRVERRVITRGAAVGTGWAVESGLKAGETIIVHGLQKVSPGQVVQTVASEK